jgi:hypothetical protein
MATLAWPAQGVQTPNVNLVKAWSSYNPIQSL